MSAPSIEATRAVRPSLYAISESFAVLESLLDEAGEGATIDDAGTVATWFAELEGALTDKLTGCVAWARSRELFIGNAKAEATRLADLARVESAKVERLKKLIREVLEVQGLKKVETPLGPVRIVANGGRAPVIIDEGVLDIEALPVECKRTTVEPIKEALRARIEAGETIEGVRIGERGSSLRIG